MSNISQKANDDNKMRTDGVLFLLRIISSHILLLQGDEDLDSKAIGSGVLDATQAR
jgi:hypothetical protein